MAPSFSFCRATFKASPSVVGLAFDSAVTGLTRERIGLAVARLVDDGDVV